jgi:hypothetical protein
MTTAPQWESVDSDVADLLHLVADETHPSVSYEWSVWVGCARQVASENGGIVDPNALRELVRGNVAPPRLGAFVHRALTSGLMVRDGWVVSDDTTGRNAGRPAMSYRWIGGER